MAEARRPAKSAAFQGGLRGRGAGLGHTGSVLGTIWQTQWVPISRPCAVTTLVSGNAARDCHSFVGERAAPARVGKTTCEQDRVEQGVRSDFRTAKGMASAAAGYESVQQRPQGLSVSCSACSHIDQTPDGPLSKVVSIAVMAHSIAWIAGQP